MKYELTEECLKGDLVIPKGYRLIEDYELLKLLRTDEKIKKLLIDDYLWCNTFNGVRAVVLGNDGMYCYNYYDGCSRGGLVKANRNLRL